MLTTCLAGCFDDPEKIRLKKDLQIAQVQTQKLTGQVEKLTAQNTSQKQQIKNLQALGPKRLDKLFTVEKIELGRSGGIDTDKKPGHDAVVVFLKPIDADGSTLKAPGDVKIQLFDLAESKKKNLFAEFVFSVDEARKHFTAGLMFYQYRFTCPWPDDKLPAHADLTLRVEFTDYLTGKTHTAQKTCKIILPPEKP